MERVTRIFNLPRISYEFLTLLLCADGFFVLLHLAHKLARALDRFDILRNDVFSIYYDLTLAESFQYVKEFWIILFFGWLVLRHRKTQYLGWGLMFMYMLSDDMLSIHEGFGTFLVRLFNVDPMQVLVGELRYQDFGELSVALAFGSAFMGLIALAYWRGNAEVRSVFHSLAVCLLVIVFFGVVTDFANRIFDEETHKIGYELTRLFEDGGEMLGMSLMCWYVYSLTKPAQALGMIASSS